MRARLVGKSDKWGDDARHAHTLSEPLALGDDGSVRAVGKFRRAESLYASGLGDSGARRLGACVVCAEWGQDSESDWTGRFWFCGEFVRGSLCNDCAAVARGAADSLGGFGLFGGGK